MASSLHQRSGAQARSAPPAGPPAASTAEADVDPYVYRPRLRGAIHHYAVFVALAVGILLVVDAQTAKARWGCIVYACSTVGKCRPGMLGQNTWCPAARLTPMP